MSAPAARDAPTTAASPYTRPGYRWYVLGVLTAVYVCHGMDRAIPGILVEPVRQEFGLSDAQLGLFSGLGFGVAFALCVLPMGYLSDRMDRRKFLAVILAVWSLFTALGGLVQSYVQLVLTRFGVGAAESGAAPVTLPLIAEIFPPERRTFAFGVFYIGPPLGGVLAAVLGGYMAAEHGWRSALLLTGVPGLVLAALLLATVAKPPPASTSEPQEPAASLGEAVRFLLREPALLCVMAGGAMIGLIAITLGVWTGSFFIRVHGLDVKQAGLLLGLGALLPAVAAPSFGWLADRLALRNPAWPLRLVWMSSLVALAAGWVMLFAPMLPLAIMGFLLGDLLRIVYAPLTNSVLIGRSPARMRGSIISLVQLVTNLAGFGLGPVLVGVMSDLYGGGTAIRYPLALGVGLYAVVIALIVVATRLLHPGPTRARRPA
jgi:MFS family permease